MCFLFTNAFRQAALDSALREQESSSPKSVAANLGLCTLNNISLPTRPSSMIWKKEFQTQNQERLRDHLVNQFSHK